MEFINKDGFTSFIEHASSVMDENKDYLIELDANLGDGDLGLTMSKGFSKAKDFVLAGSEDPLPKFIMKTGMVFAKEVPSTMGTLVASGFMKAGKAVNGMDALDAAGAALFAKSFAEGIMERGKAKVGQCTIVDALFPAGEAFTKAAEKGKSLAECAKASYEAAVKGMESTKDLEPCFGKSAVFAEKAKGVVDQGAVVGMLFFKALYESVCL